MRKSGIVCLILLAVVSNNRLVAQEAHAPHEMARWEHQRDFEQQMIERFIAKAEQFQPRDVVQLVGLTLLVLGGIFVGAIFGFAAVIRAIRGDRGWPEIMDRLEIIDAQLDRIENQLLPSAARSPPLAKHDAARPVETS